MQGIRYNTVDYVCVDCGWTARVRVAAKPHHAIHYRQAITKEKCFKCQLKKQLAECICSSCGYRRGKWKEQRIKESVR
jgi:hypothetical protein